jgi:hypothetical protein
MPFGTTFALQERAWFWLFCPSLMPRLAHWFTLEFLGSKHLYLRWGDIIMKGLLTVLVLLALVICGVGFYRGWFEFSTGKSEDKTTISVTVDKNKIKEDEEKAKDKMQDLGRQVKDKNQDKAHENPERQP